MRGEERGSKGRESTSESKGREWKTEQVKREDERGSWLYDIMSQLRVSRESNREQTSIYPIKLRERRGGTWIF